MEKRPLISIIVPVYNVNKYLRECLDSICSQEEINSEIILVDDGSTDSSGEICDEYAGKHGNIKVIHKQNGGLASARNAGLDVMSGDYVGFVDSDDYIAADMYKIMLHAMTQTGSGVACCSRFRVIDGKVTAMPKPVTAPALISGKDIIRSLLMDKEMTYSACDKLFKAELFEEVRFPKENLPSEDMPCIYGILKRVESVVYIGQAKYYYRLVNSSISKKEFSQRNISTLYYNQDIYNDVIKSMPELKSEAVFSLVQCTTSIYARMMKDGKQKECKNEKRYMERLISKKIPDIIRNPYLSFNAKLVAMSVTVRCYNVLMKLRGKVKEKNTIEK